MLSGKWVSKTDEEIIKLGYERARALGLIRVHVTEGIFYRDNDIFRLLGKMIELNLTSVRSGDLEVPGYGVHEQTSSKRLLAISMPDKPKTREQQLESLVEDLLKLIALNLDKGSHDLRMRAEEILAKGGHE